MKKTQDERIAIETIRVLSEMMFGKKVKKEEKPNGKV